MVTSQVKKGVNGSAGSIKLSATTKKTLVPVKPASARTGGTKVASAKGSSVKSVQKKSTTRSTGTNRVEPSASKAKSVKIPAVIASSEKSRKLAQAPFLDKEKFKKPKLVRDSFTMPESEYAVLSAVKKACLSAGVEVKKSQLLRIGLLLLSQTDLAKLKMLIAGLAPLKAGRPKKDK